MGAISCGSDIHDMKPVNQQIPIMVTLQITQCACINKPSTHVIITKYCPDITICISRAIIHTALCNPRQRDGGRYVTPWELIKNCGDHKINWVGGYSYKGACNPLSLNDHTQITYKKYRDIPQYSSPITC